jgi:hypothetical protein
MAALVISMGVLAYGYGQFHPDTLPLARQALTGYRLCLYWHHHNTSELQARLWSPSISKD